MLLLVLVIAIGAYDVLVLEYQYLSIEIEQWDLWLFAYLRMKIYI